MYDKTEFGNLIIILYDFYKSVTYFFSAKIEYFFF